MVREQDPTYGKTVGVFEDPSNGIHAASANELCRLVCAKTSSVGLERRGELSNLVGVAGEHFAAGELARRGFLVTLTRGNAPGIDILAYHPETKKTVALQVKAALGGNQARGKWIMSQKDEDEAAVRLPEPPDPAEYSIVPSRTVAKAIYADHRSWLATPGSKGQQRSTKNTMRHFKDPAGKWRDRWDIILALAGHRTRP